jgi:hypothetical protein
MRDYLTTLASKPEREGKEHWCLVCLFSYCLQGMERNSLPMTCETFFSLPENLELFHILSVFKSNVVEY